MSQLSQELIVEALFTAACHCDEDYILYFQGLQARVEREGIAPPDGSVLVSEQDMHNQTTWLAYLEQWIGDAAIRVLRDRYNTEPAADVKPQDGE